MPGEGWGERINARKYIKFKTEPYMSGQLVTYGRWYRNGWVDLLTLYVTKSRTWETRLYGGVVYDLSGDCVQHALGVGMDGAELFHCRDNVRDRAGSPREFLTLWTSRMKGWPVRGMMEEAIFFHAPHIPDVGY